MSDDFFKDVCKAVFYWLSVPTLIAVWLLQGCPTQKLTELVNPGGDVDTV